MKALFAASLGLLLIGSSPASQADPPLAVAEDGIRAELKDLEGRAVQLRKTLKAAEHRQSLIRNGSQDRVRFGGNCDAACDPARGSTACALEDFALPDADKPGPKCERLFAADPTFARLSAACAGVVKKCGSVAKVLALDEIKTEIYSAKDELNTIAEEKKDLAKDLRDLKRARAGLPRVDERQVSDVVQKQLRDVEKRNRENPPPPGTMPAL